MRWKPDPEPDPDPLSPDPNPVPSPKPPIPNPPPYPNPPVRPPIPQLVGWTHCASHTLVLCLAIVIIVLTPLIATPVAAAPVSVRFSEGVTHGFLLVRSLAGDVVGHGEMTQMVVEGDLLESQLVFRFKDGSLHDEKVAFSQQRVFTLIRYHLVQRGPSFPEQLDVSIDRGSAHYTVRSRRGMQEKEE